MLTCVVANFPRGKLFFSFFCFFLFNREGEGPLHFVWNSHKKKGEHTYFHWKNRVWAKEKKRRKIHIIKSLLKLSGGAKIASSY